MRVSKLILIGLYTLIPVIVQGQATGTANQLRVKVDVFGNLVVASAAQTAPLTTTTLTNARLRVDANGNLVVALSGPSLFPDGTVSAPAISFASQTDLGFYRPGANIISYAVGSNIYATFNGNNFNLTRDNSVINFGLTADTSITRTAAGKILLSGTTPMIQFGGTTVGFAAWKSATISAMDLRTADDAGFGTGRGNWSITGTLSNNGTGNFFYTSTGASAPSACGTSPAATAANGSAVFVVTGGTGGTATGCTVTMPAAATGWNCSINNITQTAAHRADRDTRQTASTTTSVTWEYVIVSTGVATAFTASDVFRGICFAY